MRFKRLLSIVLSIMMVLSLSTEAFAITINMNKNGEDVVQVETDGNKFFNVVFSNKNYKPEAKEVHTLYMGQYFELWRFPKI